MMIRIIQIAIICFFSIGSIVSQNLLWHESTALTLPEKRMEKGVFQPFRIGLHNSLELSTFALGNIVNPNIAIKKCWKNDKMVISTKHKLAYPTPLLKTLSSGGIGSLMPATSEIPTFITLSNKFLITKPLKDNQYLTGNLDLNFAPHFGNKKMTTIDFPILYYRTSVFHNGMLFKVGVGYLKSISERIKINVDLNAFYLAQQTNNLFFEQKGFATYTNKKNSFAVNAGYVVTYGNYLFGSDFSVFPVFDLVWSKKRNK